MARPGKYKHTAERQTFDLYPDVARILGVGRSTVYNAVKSGEIRVIRIGRRILVPKSEIKRLLEGHIDAES